MVDFADFGLLRAKHEEMERRMMALEEAHRLMMERVGRLEMPPEPLFFEGEEEKETKKKEPRK